MVRSQRLLQLINLLSQGDSLNATQLAQALGVSERTIFRDIQTLRLEGAEIEVQQTGGFMLAAGWLLPSINWQMDEIKALVLGAEWVAEYGDSRLQKSAKHALGKLHLALSKTQQLQLKSNTLLIAPKMTHDVQMTISALRECLEKNQKIQLYYVDLKGQISQRILWPFALAYYEETTLLIAWCENRQAFRHFRCERIQSWHMLPEQYPNNRLGLYQMWLQTQLKHENHDKN